MNVSSRCGRATSRSCDLHQVLHPAQVDFAVESIIFAAISRRFNPARDVLNVSCELGILSAPFLTYEYVLVTQSVFFSGSVSGSNASLLNTFLIKSLLVPILWICVRTASAIRGIKRLYFLTGMGSLTYSAHPEASINATRV